MEAMKKVICKRNDGYYNLTINKEYEVVSYSPKLITRNFTFPRYVAVVDDNGKRSEGHATRFILLDGQCCDEYISKNSKDVIDY